MNHPYPKTPLVVIFGRTNVGKSTLFNCLTEKKKALVSERAGTTRDSNIGEIDWRGLTIALVDTGGITDLKALGGTYRGTGLDDIDAKVQKQARDYFVRADLVLFLVDAGAGLLPQDKELARAIKKILPRKTRIILVANKVDSPAQRRELAEFNKLALGEPMAVSAVTGSGTGDLLDDIYDALKPLAKTADLNVKEESGLKPSITIGIIGKPNVGKSSLVNKLLHDERMIVSPIPHTTREPQDSFLAYAGHELCFIDTAGISRQGQKQAKPTRAHETLEKFSIAKSLNTLKRADIALLIIDICAPLTHQDAKLVEEIVSTRTSLLVIANKWDLAPERDTKKYTRYIYDHFPFARWAPIRFVSALTGEKVDKILPLILEVADGRRQMIEPSSLNRLLGRLVKKHLPAKGKGTRHPHIYELKQSRTNPPQFEIRIGARDNLHFSYIRFIENRLREKYGFAGTPISFYVDKNPHVHGQHDERVSKKAE